MPHWLGFAGPGWMFESALIAEAPPRWRTRSHSSLFGPQPVLLEPWSGCRITSPPITR